MMIRKQQTPSQTTTSRPSVIYISNGSFNEGQTISASAWFQCTAIAFYALLLLLGNNVSYPNAAAIMLLWWSEMTIIFKFR